MSCNKDSAPPPLRKPGVQSPGVGTGTGYQAAILAEMGVKVFTIEIDGSAVLTADRVLVSLGYKMDKRLRLKHARGAGDALQRYRAIRRQFRQREPITLYWGNGQRGLAERSPFKAIIVAASIPHLRHVWHLAAQLSPAGGRMVVPVGDRNEQSLAIVERTGDRIRLSTLDGISFVFLRMVLQRQNSQVKRPRYPVREPTGLRVQSENEF